MCGRYTVAKSKKVEQLLLGFARKGDIVSITPRFNAAPTQALPIVVNEGPVLARWGLVPSWANDVKIGYSMINARAETLAEKPAYKALLKRKRCLVPADGFFEWLKEGTVKTPIHFRRKDGEPFFFAGLWDCWHDELVTFTIITTAANTLVAPVHDRMPVMLHEPDYRRWLDEGDTSLLRSYPVEEMEGVAVNRLVNSPKNDSPECLAEG